MPIPLAPVAVAPYDLAPLLPILLVGAALALAVLAWLWLRHRDPRPAARQHALTILTLFLTFDLVVFGAFTRLTDSGLGCPDWPGCYASASPSGAKQQIGAAQAVMPSGPVTHRKAWIEMIHRYLATAVGALITLLAAWSWLAAYRAKRRSGRLGRSSHSARTDAARDRPVSPWWATATLLWVCLQGAFGAWTVTMKLYPAIVTAHLLGGIGLLVLLAVQSQMHVRRPLAIPGALRGSIVAVAVLTILQIALGGWVSTNYAVLACRDFPTCQGSFWPPMDFESGFTLLRGLGVSKDGSYLPFAALTAIHYAHRLGAYVLLAAMLALAWRLQATGDPALRRWSMAIAGAAAWQLLSGLGNVLLGWPLAAALAHTAGAAGALTLLAILITRARQTGSATQPSSRLQPSTSPGSPGSLRQAP